MSKKTNPPKGSTRSILSNEEREWLRDFEAHEKRGDKKSLEKISESDELFRDVVQAHRRAEDAARRDIYSNQKSVRISPVAGSSFDDSFDRFIEGDDSVEHHIEDETLAPRISVDRYTAEDYNKPSFPDEEGLIDLIDAEREQIEADKIIQISKRKEVEDAS